MENGIKARTLYFILPLIFAILLAAALLVLAARASPTFASPLMNRASEETSPASAIIARRIISIPFGIDTNLALLNEGGAVQVSGHGTCPAGGENFRIKVTVTQGSASQRAMGSTQESCGGDSPVLWSAQATTPDAIQLSPGNAEACAMAVIHTEKDAVVFKWCKAVVLQ